MTDIPSSSGIYRILNNVTGKYYVGSSVNLKDREHTHFTSLSRGKHFNSYLQKDYIKYGNSEFSFEILELVEYKEFLLEREQYYLDLYKSYNPAFGYNILKLAGRTLGRVCSKETRIKLSIAGTGKTHTPETKAKISKLKKGNTYNKGRVLSKPRTQLHKDKIGKALGKRVGNLTTGENFNSIREACRVYKADSRDISKACENKECLYKNCRWIYL